MKKNNLKPVAAAVGTGMVMALAMQANAADNPFQMIEFGEGVTVAGDAVDMQGNKVKIDQETGFEYGGDQKAGYSGGKLGTGAKDPAVCGTFAGDTCSMPHVKK
jgi:hypothetical protein